MLSVTLFRAMEIMARKRQESCTVLGLNLLYKSIIFMDQRKFDFDVPGEMVLVIISIA